MGMKVEAYMNNAKMFRSESDLYDFLEKLKANLSITTELEKVDRQQIDKLSFKVEALEDSLEDFAQMSLFRFLLWRWGRRNESS
jgi:hypothetical protein